MGDSGLKTFANVKLLFLVSLQEAFIYFYPPFKTTFGVWRYLQVLEWIYIVYIPLSLMHFSISFMSPTEKKFHLTLLFFFFTFNEMFSFVQNEMLLQKCLRKQHASLTAECLWIEKSSKLYDLEGAWEVFLSDILQTKSYCRLSDHHPPGGIQNVRQEGESEPRTVTERKGKRNHRRRIHNFLYWWEGQWLENTDLIWWWGKWVMERVKTCSGSHS